MGVEKFGRRNWIYVLKYPISGTSMAMAMDVPRLDEETAERGVSTWRDSVGPPTFGDFKKLVLVGWVWLVGMVFVLISQLLFV